MKDVLIQLINCLKYIFLFLKVIAENSEPALFTQYFKSWKSKDQTVGFGKVFSAHKIAHIKKVYDFCRTLYFLIAKKL